MVAEKIDVSFVCGSFASIHLLNGNFFLVFKRLCNHLIGHKPRNSIQCNSKSHYFLLCKMHTIID